MHTAYSAGETIAQGILRKSHLNVLPTHISYRRENTDCGKRLKGKRMKTQRKRETSK
jgi:hypothetical protein